MTKETNYQTRKEAWDEKLKALKEAEKQKRKELKLQKAEEKQAANEAEKIKKFNQLLGLMKKGSEL